VVDGNCEIQEVYRLRPGFNGPSKHTKIHSRSLEFGPILGIFRAVKGGSPYDEGIINIAPIELQKLSIFVEKVKFMDSIVEGGIGRGWWCTHSCTILLFPKSISKFEQIVSHKEFQGF
jgi:hypothetical protein